MKEYIDKLNEMFPFDHPTENYFAENKKTTLIRRSEKGTAILKIEYNPEE